jgi:type III secretory pathway component EscV
VGNRDTIQDPSTPLPEAFRDCEECQTRIDYRRERAERRIAADLRSRRTPWIVGGIITIGLAFVSGYVTLHFMARANAAQIEVLRDGRHEDREWLTRLGGQTAKLETEAAAERSKGDERMKRIEDLFKSIDGRLGRLEDARARGGR